jgi:cytochrome c peroxidase
VEGKVGLRHSQADYQKVYDRIAESLEKEGYDGESSPITRVARESRVG